MEQNNKALSATRKAEDQSMQSIMPIKNDSYLPLFMLAAGVLALWLISWWLVITFLDTSTEQGQFGDMFGAVNALFSGLAFAGIVYTILLQRKELGLQRIELAATRAELRRTAKAQEDAKEALAQQVTNQLRSARIHGLSTLVEHFTERLNDVGSNGYTRNEPAHSQHMASRDQFLQDLIKEVENSAGP
jgi:hypothetical protein